MGSLPKLPNLPSMPADILGSQTPKVDPEIYQKISEEISNIICKGIYTNKKDGTNMSENINRIITQKVIDALNSDKISDKIQNIIFGNDDEKHPKGLRKFIQDAIKVCDGGNKDQIYAFSGRILQTLFNTKDNIIDDLLEIDEIKQALNDSVQTEKDIIELMKKQILLQLSGSFKMKESIETKDKISPSKEPDFLGNIKNMFTFPKVVESPETKEAACKRQEPVSLPTPIELKEVATPPTTQLSDFLKTSNEIQTHIVSEIERSINNEKIEYIVNMALDKIIKSVLGKISNTISETVISKYTDSIINNKTVKLQIFYSILSYDEKTDVDDCGNSKKNDNTLYIAKEIMMQALAKKRSNEGKGEKLIKILNDLLVEAIAKRGGDLLGRSVASINAITDLGISGGSKLKKQKSRKSTSNKKNKKTKTLKKYRKNRK
jgi:hypothetical protein